VGEGWKGKKGRGEEELFFFYSPAGGLEGGRGKERGREHRMSRLEPKGGGGKGGGRKKGEGGDAS